MFNFKKAVLGLASLALLAGLSLTGCAPANVELELYYYKQEATDGLKKMFAEFTKENPNITIKPLIVPDDAGATLKTRSAAGNLPDIVQLQSYNQVFEYAGKGYLADLSSEPVMAKVLDSAKSAVSLNGKQYAVPMDFAGIGIIYNKKIFAQYGLTPPTTFPELQAVAATLKKNGVTPFAGLLKANWSIGHFVSLVHTSLLGAKGGNEAILKFIADMNTGTTSFGKDVAITDVTSIIDWYKSNMDSNATEMDWNEQQAAFAQEKAAMMVQGLWSYGAAITTNPDLDCGFVPFPVTANAADTKFFADVDSTFAVSAQSTPEKQAAAKKFLEWLASPAAVKMWTTDVKLTSSFKGADLSAMQTPFQDLMGSVAKLGAYPWAFSMYPNATFETAVKTSGQAYVFGQKTAADLVADIDKSWAENKAQ